MDPFTIEGPQDHGWRPILQAADELSCTLSSVTTAAVALTLASPAAAMLLEELVRHLRPSELIVTSFGIRVGLLYSALPDADRELDPLLEAAEAFAHRTAEVDLALDGA